jgi:glycine betaine/choline ABC-type transport system substrate-binding protein
MRIDRRIVLGAALVALVVFTSACGSGGDDEPSGDGGTATIASQLTLGGPPECPERPFCIIGLRDVYGVEFGSFRPLDTGGELTVAALDSGQIDVALLFSTSSVIAANGWVVLEDDRQLQQADNIAPVVREEVLNDEITELLNAVSEAIDSDNIVPLNARVEIDREEPADVAATFLQEQGLLPTGGDGDGTPVTVGVSAAFAENQIVAEMYAQMLEAAGYDVARQLDLGTREISDAALEAGEIDVKPEYLGSQLAFEDPGQEVSGDPAEVAGLLAPLLEERGIVLLPYSAANDTNSFVVTQETADTYALRSVSDLADPAP